MARYVLDLFAGWLPRLKRLSSASRPARAPRVEHVPHVHTAEGIRIAEPCVCTLPHVYCCLTPACRKHKFD